MKKAFLFTLLLASLTFAQITPIKYGASGLLGIPTGDFGDLYNNGYGGTAHINIAIPGPFTLTGSVGYATFALDNDYINQKLKELDSTPQNAPTVNLDMPFSMIPVTVGVKYSLFNAVVLSPYASAELGLAFTTLKLSGNIEYNSSGAGSGTVKVPTETKSDTKSTFGIGIGTEINAAPNLTIDIAAKFNIISVEFSQSVTKTQSGGGSVITTTESSSSSGTFFGISAGLLFRL
ncbi:MAG: outer membrane beta-barrel protein [Ignavibacteriaceae bacterium]|nr:outer membrane beta-barrel protein [Ignavibacteriaceae bacterium]NUM69943.1 outer membrane beta-barrel protein [Ignavibacteriaceae bacterium]